MSSNQAEIAIEAPCTSNPLDVIPDEIPFDVPYAKPVRDLMRDLERVNRGEP
jgi:hypothetical protein